MCEIFSVQYLDKIGTNFFGIAHSKSANTGNALGMQCFVCYNCESDKPDYVYLIRICGLSMGGDVMKYQLTIIVYY